MEGVHSIVSFAGHWSSLDVPSKEMVDHNVVTDRIIDAYTAGIHAGRNKERQEISALLRKTLRENAVLAASITREVLDFLESKNIGHEQPFLRIANLSEFRILIPVREQDFVRDEFDAVYEMVWEVISRHTEEWFQPSLNFLPIANPKHINHKVLLSDGYTLRFG